MKKLITIISITLSTLVFSQNYSTYYGAYDVKDSNKVDEHSTINSIDYEALSAVNAEQEYKRLNAMQYSSRRELLRAKKIAENHMKAWRFGYAKWRYYKTNERAGFLLKKTGRLQTFYWIPYSKLFTTEATYEYENVFPILNINPDSSIVCEIDIYHPFAYQWEDSKKDDSRYPRYYSLPHGGEKYDDFYSEVVSVLRGISPPPEKTISEIMKDEVMLTFFGVDRPPVPPNMSKLSTDLILSHKVGEVIEIHGEKYFTHKTELDEARVFGKKGYRATWIYETDLEYVIKDYYYSHLSGILYHGRITYTVEKTRGTFEDLEGRRYYLNPLVEKVISSASFNIQLNSN